MTIMWRSKLGNEFPKEEIDRDEKKHKAELDRLRIYPYQKNAARVPISGDPTKSSV